MAMQQLRPAPVLPVQAINGRSQPAIKTLKPLLVNKASPLPIIAAKVNNADNKPATANNSLGHNIEFKEQLGKGGFGEVFRCTDEKGNQYAVKCIDMAKSGIPHPLELSMMASIRHPYLNYAHRIYINKETDRICIFMDLAKGDLSKIVRKDKNPEYTPDPSKVRRWLQQLVAGLACMHSQKLIHADIKSGNILIFGDDENAKLSDFSLVAKIWKPDTKYSHQVGTSTHRPLENLMGHSWDLSLDIWSLGVTIYEIIYGRLLFPYQGDVVDKKRRKERIAKGQEPNDHITERCINCLLDWADNGPIKQSYDITPFKYNWKKFQLVPEFYQDPYKINDILLRMLMIDPKKRPTIQEIMAHPFFNANIRITPALIGTPVDKIKKDKVERILNICNQYGLGASVIALSIELYGRSMKIPRAAKTRDYRLLACIWLAAKIIRKKIPPIHTDKEQKSNTIFNKSEDKIKAQEKEICLALEFRLHHASNAPIVM